MFCGNYTCVPPLTSVWSIVVVVVAVVVVMVMVMIVVVNTSHALSNIHKLTIRIYRQW